MLNWISREFLMAVIISLAVVVVALSLSGPPYQNQREQRSEHSQTNNSHTNARNDPVSLQIECDPNCFAKNSEDHGDQPRFTRLINKTIDDPVALFTFFLGVATFFLVIVVLGQVKDARESSERQLRAYVFITAAKIHDFGIQSPIKAQIIIKNSGQTPAYNLVPWIGITIEYFPLTATLQRPGEGMKQSRASLGPGTERQLSVTAGRPLTPIEIDDIKAGTKAIYIHGEAIYCDTFKRERFIRFRLMYGGGAGIAPEGAMTHCEEGNETSED